MSETIKLRLYGSVRAEPEQDHASVRLAVTEDQITEVGVVRDQNPSLLMGKSEDLIVRESRRVVTRQTNNIVAVIGEVV